GSRISRRNRREDFLSFYALLTLIALFAIWAGALMVGFALVHRGFGSQLTGEKSFWMDLYMSGSTLVKLGLGDFTTTSYLARLLTVVEAGTGFGFLALGLAYVPVLYQAF